MSSVLDTLLLREEEVFDPKRHPRGPLGRFIRTLDGRLISHDSARREQTDYQAAHGKPSPYLPGDVKPYGGNPAIVRQTAASAAQAPARETTAQEIARKSPGAQRELEQYKSVLAGARSSSPRLAVSPDIPAPADRHGGFKVGDRVTYKQNYGVGMESGEVARLSRNGNLTVRGSKGTTVDVHHSKARISSLHPATTSDAVLGQMARDRATIAKEKKQRAQAIRQLKVSESVMDALLERS